jgi:hypothetical protein
VLGIRILYAFITIGFWVGEVGPLV